MHSQRERGVRYRAAVHELLDSGEAFPCACSRRDIAAAAKTGAGPMIYPGTCRDGIPQGREARSIRLRVPEHEIAFDDQWSGRIRQHLAHEVGDFILWRAEGCASYHLATVLDDAERA